MLTNPPSSCTTRATLLLIQWLPLLTHAVEEAVGEDVPHHSALQLLLAVHHHPARESYVRTPPKSLSRTRLRLLELLRSPRLRQNAANVLIPGTQNAKSTRTQSLALRPRRTTPAAYASHIYQRMTSFNGYHPAGARTESAQTPHGHVSHISHATQHGATIPSAKCA